MDDRLPRHYLARIKLRSYRDNMDKRDDNHLYCVGLDCGGSDAQPCIVARRNAIVLDRQSAVLRKYPARPAPTPIPGPPGVRDAYESDEFVLYLLVAVTWVITLLTAYLVGAS